MLVPLIAEVVSLQNRKSMKSARSKEQSSELQSSLLIEDVHNLKYC